MKRLLLAAAGSMMMISAAQAADVIGPAAYVWTGPYLGLQAGVAFTSGNTGVDEDFYNAPGEKVGLDNQADFIGGVTAGYNYQINQLVLGAEADLSYWGYKANGRSDVADDTKYQADADWLGTIRARLGFAFDSTLIFVTGGAAYADLKYSVKDDSQTPGGADMIDAEKKQHWGWTAGGGLEQSFSDNLSAKIEYLYVQFPDATASGRDSLAGDRFGFGFDSTGIHIVRAGLNWHF